MTTAYLAPEGFADQLQEELQRAGVAVVQRHERLFICDGQAIAAAWAALARLRRAARRVDRQRGAGAARYPAQLGHVRAAASSPRRPDRGAPAARLGQAGRLSRRSAHGPAGVVD